MTKTIEIRFLAQPQAGDSFSYTIKVNGTTLTYPGGLASVSKNYAAFSSAPNGILLGASLGASAANTLNNLQTFNPHANVNYAMVGNSVFVTVNYTGTLSIESITQVSGRIMVFASGDVIFNNGFDANKLRMAYNNDIIRFSGNNPDPLYCDVAFADVALQLYPAPDGSFFLNMKPYAAALINTKNFEDTVQTNLEVPNPSSFVYDAEGIHLSLTVTFTIVYEGSVQDTFETNLSWLAGAEQHSDYHLFDVNNFLVLSPFKKDTANHYYLKYWQGYPFDIPLYMNPVKQFTMKNLTTQLGQLFSVNGVANRLFLSDGRTDETLEELVPLIEGFNTVRFIKKAEESDDDKFVILEKVPYQCGLYLKWINKYGGYSYWLFEDTYSIDRSAKSLGELDRDTANLEDSFGRTMLIGRESQDSMKIVAELLTADESRIVEGIIDSPKIYLFTGRPYSKNGPRDWTEVQLKTNNARIKNARQPLTNFTFDIELPARFTQTL